MSSQRYYQIIQDLKNNKFDSYDQFLFQDNVMSAFVELFGEKSVPKKDLIKSIENIVQSGRTDYILDRVAYHGFEMYNLISLVFIASFKLQQQGLFLKAEQIINRMTNVSWAQDYSSINGTILLTNIICTEDAELFCSLMDFCYQRNSSLFYSLWKQLSKPIKPSFSFCIESLTVLSKNDLFQSWFYKYKDLMTKDTFLSLIEDSTRNKERQHATQVIVDLVLDEKVSKDILKYVLSLYL